jgi:putative sigma-54 modulation protein
LDIQLTCRHCEITEEVREYVAAKMERVLRHFDGLHYVEMTFTPDGTGTKAELIVGTVRGQRFVATATHAEMFGAVDLVADKMDHQVKKLKGKLRGHRGGPEAPPPKSEE